MLYAVPRGADWLATAFAFYLELITSAFNRIFHSADERHLEALAVRRYADQVRLHSPSMANDLYAAADRHLRDM